ncbi:MAG: formylglycine-generating enzyme family protein [bacterium]|nr:formylglycine-generating enzyme family protein [bacterium]
MNATGVMLTTLAAISMVGQAGPVLAVPSDVHDPLAEPRENLGSTDMAYIEGGRFEMGDVFDENVALATPVHTVTVSSFHLARYEVTVEEFSEFATETGYLTLAENPAARARQALRHPAVADDERYLERLTTRGAFVLTSPSEGEWVGVANWQNPLYAQGPKDPVTTLSWWDAVSYCNWLSERHGLPVAYDLASGGLLDAQGRPTVEVTQVQGFRLPTEAEWEFAARERGKRIRFGNGRNVARLSEINFDAGGGEVSFAESGESRGKTTPVGSFTPNALGLYDMSGNVWEWCSDFVDRYPSAPTEDPYQVNGDVGQRRAARGGSWVGDARIARVAARFGWLAEDRCNNIGFRIARSK